jgi:hypothetical protein
VKDFANSSFPLETIAILKSAMDRSRNTSGPGKFVERPVDCRIHFPQRQTGERIH